MGLHRLGERIGRLDGHLGPGGFERTPEPDKAALATFRIEGNDLDPAPATRLRFDAVRIGEPAAGPDLPQNLVQRIAAGKGQRRIDALRCELVNRFGEMTTLAVNRAIRAEPLHQRHPSLAGSHREHARAAIFRELQRKTANTSTRRMDDDRFATLDAQRPGDAIERGQTRGRDGAGGQHVESRRNRGDIRGREGDELGVKTALGIAEAVGIDAVADRDFADARADRNHCAGAIGTQDNRTARPSPGPPAFAHLHVPTGEAGGMHREEHVAGVESWGPPRCEPGPPRARRACR